MLDFLISQNSSMMLELVAFYRQTFSDSLKVSELTIVLKFKSNSDAKIHNFPTAASTKKCKLALN